MREKILFYVTAVMFIATWALAGYFDALCM